MNKIHLISVVIPAYNEEKTIALTLNSLLAQEEYPSEIIVVDNNSTDQTNKISSSFVKKFKDKQINLKIVKEYRQGVGISRNRGFLSAENSIIASTDADTLVAADWIKSINNHFEKNDSIAVSGKIIFFDSPFLFKLITQLGWYQFLHYTGLFLFGFMSIHTANCAVKLESYKKCGGFNNQIVDPGKCDDFEISSRLAKYGKIRFDPRIKSAISFRRYNTPKKFVTNSYMRIKAWFSTGLRCSK